MAPGAPRAKRKVARGGGKKFSRNLKPLEDEETSIPQDAWDEPGEKDAPGDESEEESEEESSAEDNQETITRTERKAAAKAKKEAVKARAQAATPASGDDNEDEDEDDAPDVQIHGHAGIKVSNPNDPANSAAGVLSRREREAVEAVAAKERYWKLQEAGKTDQARADMARLTIIKQEREEKARQRKAELEEKKALAEAKADSRGKRK